MTFSHVSRITINRIFQRKPNAFCFNYGRKKRLWGNLSLNYTYKLMYCHYCVIRNKSVTSACIIRFYGSHGILALPTYIIYDNVYIFGRCNGIYWRSCTFYHIFQEPSGYTSQSAIKSCFCFFRSLLIRKDGKTTKSRFGKKKKYWKWWPQVHSQQLIFLQSLIKFYC